MHPLAPHDSLHLSAAEANEELEHITATILLQVQAQTHHFVSQRHPIAPPSPSLPFVDTVIPFA